MYVHLYVVCSIFMPTNNYIPSMTTILNLTAKFQSANLKGIQAQETAPLELASLPNCDTHCKQPHTYVHTYCDAVCMCGYSIHTYVHDQAMMKEHNSTETTTLGGSILMCDHYCTVHNGIYCFRTNLVPVRDPTYVSTGLSTNVPKATRWSTDALATASTTEKQTDWGHQKLRCKQMKRMW